MAAELDLPPSSRPALIFFHSRAMKILHKDVLLVLEHLCGEIRNITHLCGKMHDITYINIEAFVW